MDIAPTSGITYKTLWDMKKKIPSGYRAGVKMFMNYATFCDIQALTDTNGQPIARVNYGLNGDMQPSVLGTPVVFSDDIELMRILYRLTQSLHSSSALRTISSTQILP